MATHGDVDIEPMTTTTRAERNPNMHRNRFARIAAAGIAATALLEEIMRIKDRMSTGAVIGVATLLSTVLLAPPVSAAVGGDGPDRTPSCAPAGAPKVVDVTAHVTNSVDFGIDGHPWAIDTAEEHLQVWQVGDRRFCMRVDYGGAFRAFGSTSPNMTGMVSEGVEGTMTQTSVFTRVGTLSSTLPTTGDVGVWDRGCANGTCAQPCLHDAYVPDAKRRHEISTLARYDGGLQGMWTAQLGVNGKVISSSGDITG